MEIRCQIRNQRPQKPWSKKFHENRWVFKILCPPFIIPTSNVKFIISDPKSFWVQSFAEIVRFPKLHVRHIGYPSFCEGYGYLRSVRQFFSFSLTIPIIVDHSYDQVPILFWFEKKLWKKKILDFLVIFSKFGVILNFRLDQTQFDEHGFRLEISVF